MTLCASCARYTASRLLRSGARQGHHPFEQRALDVAVIGAPNAGKSLLTNQLIKAAVSAVSSKMDTTTSNNEAIITEDDVQLVVIDSPGTVGLKHAREFAGRKYQEQILSDPEAAITKAQHVLVVQDATQTGDYIHHRVLHMLHRNEHIPSSLVFNKVDLVSDRSELLELTRILTNGQVAGEKIKVASNTIGRLGNTFDKLKLHAIDTKNDDPEWMAKYRRTIAKPTHICPYKETKHLFMDIRGWSNFSAVFFASALTGEGIQPLRNHLKTLAEKREWRMDPSAVTTKRPQDICAESVRGALLDVLPSDLAYNLQPKVSEWNQDGEVLQIVVDIPCKTERIAKLIIGKSGGSRIIEIGQRVNDHLATLFQRQLFVRILVKHQGKIVNFSPSR
ncbi:unnamed protein product, partial [Mesorhabditis spiculigera]